MKLKVLLSIWILFHLTVLVVFPNTFSFIKFRYLSVFKPYVQLMGLNYAWSFYAPEPETAMYLEYDVQRESEEFVNLPTETHRWPPERDGYFDIYFNRRHTNMGFVTQRTKWLESLFIPWACRTNPGATRIVVRKIGVRVPTLDEVQEGAPIFDPDMTYEERIGSGYCKETR